MLAGRVHLRVGLLFGGVSVGVGLLADGRVQFLLFNFGVLLFEDCLLFGGGDFRLLLLDLESLGLFGGGDALHRVGLGLRLVGDGLEFGSFQVKLVLTDGHVLFRVDGRELRIPADFGGHFSAHVGDDVLTVGEVLNVERGQLKAKPFHVHAGGFGHGRGERVPVLHECLQLGPADDLAQLA